jgi:exonuclease III
MKNQKSNLSTNLKKIAHEQNSNSNNKNNMKQQWLCLNISRLNSPVKRHRLTEWLHKQDPTFCCIQETHLRDKDRHYPRVKGWKTICQANGPRTQGAVVIIISNKIDFQTWSYQKT